MTHHTRVHTATPSRPTSGRWAFTCTCGTRSRNHRTQDAANDAATRHEEWAEPAECRACAVGLSGAAHGPICTGRDIA